jgi:hypothetical protein
MEVSPLRVRPDAEYPRFEVEHTGPGIPASCRSQIFEKFWCGPGSGMKSVGLGLSIARNMISAHGEKPGSRVRLVAAAPSGSHCLAPSLSDKSNARELVSRALPTSELAQRGHRGLSLGLSQRRPPPRDSRAFPSRHSTQAVARPPRTGSPTKPSNFNRLASRCRQGLTARPLQKETNARSLLRRSH